MWAGCKTMCSIEHFAWCTMKKLQHWGKAICVVYTLLGNTHAIKVKCIGFDVESKEVQLLIYLKGVFRLLMASLFSAQI